MGLVVGSSVANDLNVSAAEATIKRWVNASSYILAETCCGV